VRELSLFVFVIQTIHYTSDPSACSSRGRTEEANALTRAKKSSENTTRLIKM